MRSANYYGYTFFLENGEVFSKNNKLMKQSDSHGYPVIDLFIDRKKKRVIIHRIIAKLFIPNPENKDEVNHKNGIRHDNRIENLEWMTREENNMDAINRRKNTDFRYFKGAMIN